MITGVSRLLGSRLAQRLEGDPGVEAIVGVDLEEPEPDLERTEFVRADIRNPSIAEVVDRAGVDTLVHLAVIATPTRVGGRSAMKEINVMGSLQLLAACQRSPTLRKLVVKSTTAVYGGSSRDPALFTEDMVHRATPASGYAKDAVEVEQFARDFGRRRPDASLTILRFANFMGSEIETPLTRYFALPVIPTAMGYDPRIQLVHEDDAAEILFRATRQDHPGIFNAAAEGVVTLSQAVRLCGKVAAPVPLPFAAPVAGALRRFGLVDFPSDQLQFLVYGRVADTTRLKERFGYSPRLTTREALEEFVRGRRLRRLVTPERAAHWEENVYEFLRGGRPRERVVR
jgi:UDP-glucose 4-epimerase